MWLTHIILVVEGYLARFTYTCMYIYGDCLRIMNYVFFLFKHRFIYDVVQDPLRTSSPPMLLTRRAHLNNGRNKKIVKDCRIYSCCINIVLLKHSYGKYLLTARSVHVIVCVFLSADLRIKQMRKISAIVF